MLFESLKNSLESWHSQQIECKKSKQKQVLNKQNALFQWNEKIESLPIRKETKDLILSGAPVGQRSETIQKVINALVYSGLTDQQINDIFRQYPIGDKNREKSNPEKWLQPQIDKGRVKVTNRATATYNGNTSSST